MINTYLLPLGPLFVVESHSVKGGLDERLIDILPDEDD